MTEQERKIYSSPRFQELLARYEQAEQEGEIDVFSEEECLLLAKYYQQTMARTMSMVRTVNRVLDCGLQFYPQSEKLLSLRSRMAFAYLHDSPQAHYFADEISDKTSDDSYLTMVDLALFEEKIEEADRLLVEAYQRLDDSIDKEYLVYNAIRKFIDHKYFDYVDKWMAMAQNRQSLIYRELVARFSYYKGNFLEAEKRYRLLTLESPKNVDYWVHLFLSLQMNKKYEEALKAEMKALSLDSDNAVALSSAGISLIALNRYEEALPYLSCAVRRDPSILNCRMLLDTLETLELWEEYERVYKQALRCYRKKHKFLLNIVFLIYEKNAELFASLIQEYAKAHPEMLDELIPDTDMTLGEFLRDFQKID